MDTNANTNRESFEDQQVIFCGYPSDSEGGGGTQRAREFRPCWSRRRAETPPSITTLACAIPRATGTDKDPAQAARWFALASEDGDLRATDLLGRCYQSGAGVEKDEARAAELFQQAAEQDYAPPSATWA